MSLQSPSGERIGLGGIRNTARKIDRRGHHVAGNIEFGGEEKFQASPEKVYGLLTDLDAMAAIIPDLESAETADANSLKCVVRPGFSFLRGKMKLTISLSDLEPPRSAVMGVAAKGIGVSMEVNSQLNVAAEGDGSLLKWSATVEKLTGLISVVSPALIKASADQVIRHAWTQVRAKLEEEA
jgi:carbon monoxide dehydrogenase subunit G